MMGTNARSPMVALLEWNDSGHHATYLRLYTRALLRLGCRLAVLSPRPEELHEWWTGESGLSGEVLARAVALPMPPRQYSPCRPRRLQTWRRWLHRRAVARALCAAESRFGGHAGLVFFSCIYEREAVLVENLARGVRRPWSGLYMQAESYRRPAGTQGPPRFWRVPRLAGLLTLDEEMAPIIEQDAGVPVFAAPDLVDVTPGDDPDLKARLEEFRRGRALVGLLGHLQPSKGLLTLAEAASLPGAERLAFVFAGEVAWALFSADEAARFRRMTENGARVLLLEGRIPSEAAYNQILSSCDFIFAAYHDFPHSSNTLGKAAAFHRPVVVSEGHLMARRVRAHGLGEVVPQRDATAALAALLRLKDAPSFRPEGAGAYLRMHGEEALERALERLLGTLRISESS